MRPYGVYFRERVLLQAPKTGRRRETIMKFVRELANDPFRRCDYQDRDDAGHELEVKIIGDHAIIYWADHAVREVKILAIQIADPL